MRVDDLQKIAAKRGLKADTLDDLMMVEFAVNFQDEVAHHYNMNYAAYEKADADAWFETGYKTAKAKRAGIAISAVNGTEDGIKYAMTLI